MQANITVHNVRTSEATIESIELKVDYSVEEFMKLVELFPDLIKLAMEG